MKKFLGILVLGLLVCNTGFAKEHTYDDQLRIMEDQVLQQRQIASVCKGDLNQKKLCEKKKTKNIEKFKKILIELEEITDAVCAKEPKDTHEKLIIGGCYDHRIQVKSVKECMQFGEECKYNEKWFKDKKVEKENVAILKILETEPPKKKSIALQCYYDKNNHWIDYKLEVDRKFIEYHLFQYKRNPNNLNFDEKWQHNFFAELKLSVISDTIGYSRVFPRWVEIQYNPHFPKKNNVIAYSSLNSKLDENNDIVSNFEWQFRWDENWKGNTVNLTESTLSFEFKNQESYHERNGKEEIWLRTTDKVNISLHSGLFNFYRFENWTQGQEISDIFRGECSGTQELYKYIAYIKAFIEEFEKVRAKIRKGESTETAEAGVVSGTAFFINNRGNLLTNNHVVEGCKSQKISYFNKEYDTEIVATDKTLDLALLEAKLRPKSYLTFSKDEPKKLQIIYIAGYPLGKYLSDDLKIDDGKINALKGFEDNSNEIQVSVPINPGNSGGPIVNKRGELVAIAVAGMSKDVTEGINFGIKSSAAENFLKSNKIIPNKSLMSSAINIGTLVKILEESTVYTFCE